MDGYVKSADGSCLECNGSISASIVFPIFVLLAFVAAIAYFIRSGRMQIVAELSFQAARTKPKDLGNPVVTDLPGGGVGMPSKGISETVDIATKLAVAESRKHIEPILNHNGLVWDDVAPVLEKLGSAAEVQEMAMNPMAYLERVAGSAGSLVVKLAVAKLRPRIEPAVTKHGLAWEDVESILQSVDSVEKLQEAAADPMADLERAAGGSGGSLATKLAVAKLRPRIEPEIESLGLTWEDVEPILQSVDSVEKLQEAAADPKAYLESAIDGSGGSFFVTEVEVDLPGGDEVMDEAGPSSMNGSTEIFEVIVPDGVGPGEVLAVTAPWGGVFEVVVPDGLGPGMAMRVELPGAPAAETPSPPPSPPPSLPSSMRLPSASSFRLPTLQLHALPSPREALRSVSPSASSLASLPSPRNAALYAAEAATAAVERVDEELITRIQVKGRILVSMIQVVSSLGIVFNVPYPTFFSSFVRALSIFSLDLFAVMPFGCVASLNHDHYLLIRTLVPLFLLAISFLYRRRLQKKMEKYKARGALLKANAFRRKLQKLRMAEQLADQLLTYNFVLIYLLFPSNSANIFATFNCETLDDADRSRFLRIDFSVNCDDPGHQTMMIYAGFMVLVYPIGVPALYAFILFNLHGGQLQLLRSLELRQVALEADRSAAEELKAVRRKQRMSLLDAVQLAARGGQANVSGAKDLWEARRRSSLGRRTSSGDADEDQRLAQITDEIAKLHREEQKLRSQLPDYVQKLILGYELRAFYFEIIESVRKLAIVCLPVFFRPSGSVSQLIFGLMVCFITFGTHVAFHPYDHSEDDFLAQLSQVQIFFSLVSAIALKYDKGTLDDASGMDTLLSMITMVPFLVTIYLETPLRRQVNQFIGKHSPLRQTTVGSDKQFDKQFHTYSSAPVAAALVATPSNIRLRVDDENDEDAILVSSRIEVMQSGRDIMRV